MCFLSVFTGVCSFGDVQGVRWSMSFIIVVDGKFKREKKFGNKASLWDLPF